MMVDGLYVQELLAWLVRLVLNKILKVCKIHWYKKAGKVETIPG